MRYSFRRALPAIALLALAVRVVSILANADFPVVGDALAFHLEGAHLAGGEGFRRAFEDAPTAEYPPLHIVFVAVADLLGLRGIEAQKLFFAVVGTVTVVLVALLGRAAARSDRVGVIAGVLAALYPMLWMPDGALMAETTYGLFVTATLLAAVALLRRPTLRNAALLGVAGALAALTRGEGVGLVALLGIAVAWRAPVAAARAPGGPPTWRVRARLVAVVGVTALVVIAPWTIRNLQTFDEPVPISANANEIWVGANCPSVYYGPLIGSWRFDCYGARPPGDESARAAVYRRRGLDYMKDHTGRLPLVALARLGRVLDVYKPWDQGAFINAGEGRHPRATHLGLVAYWLLVPFAICGALLLRRRREPALLVLLVPVVLVLAVAVVTYGSTRFRFAAEPGLVVLGAVTVEALLSGLSAALRARRRPASATATSDSAGISQSQSIEAWKA
jgi:4-amino-4-deoxy-L-arabinose transferase-like glycosyltransferase